ncbi:hypothetical protein ACFQH6_03725 [Halobacteriaceae archaeon GCM10025711]
MQKPEDTEAVDLDYYGFLTKSHRDWLLGRKDVSESYQRKIISEIRSRFEGAAKDMRLLGKYYPKGELKKAFQERHNQKDNGLDDFVQLKKEDFDTLIEVQKTFAMAVGGQQMGETVDVLAENLEADLDDSSEEDLSAKQKMMVKELSSQVTVSFKSSRLSKSEWLETWDELHADVKENLEAEVNG